MSGLLTDLLVVRQAIDALVGSAGIIGEEMLSNISSTLIKSYDTISNAQFDLLSDVTVTELITDVSL